MCIQSGTTTVLVTPTHVLKHGAAMRRCHRGISRAHTISLVSFRKSKCLTLIRLNVSGEALQAANLTEMGIGNQAASQIFDQ